MCYQWFRWVGARIDYYFLEYVQSFRINCGKVITWSSLGHHVVSLDEKIFHALPVTRERIETREPCADIIAAMRDHKI